VTLVFVAFIPPAWFLTAIRRPPTKRHWVRRIPRLLGSYMALFALVFLATIAGDAAVARLITLKSDSEHMRLVIEGRFCNLAADRPSADFAVNNPTNRPIFVTPYETTEVGVLIPDADFPADEFGEFEFYSPREATNKVTPVLIRPNDTEIVRFDVPQELAARAAKPYSCLVHRRPGANVDEIKWQDEEFKEFM
jgi:hypothetical protein